MSSWTFRVGWVRYLRKGYTRSSDYYRRLEVGFMVAILKATVVGALGLGLPLVSLTPTLGKASGVRTTRQEKTHVLRLLTEYIYIYIYSCKHHKPILSKNVGVIENKTTQPSASDSCSNVSQRFRDRLYFRP